MDKKDFSAYGRSVAHTSKLHFFADDTPFSSFNFFGKQKRSEVVSSSCASVALQCRVCFFVLGDADNQPIQWFRYEDVSGTFA